MAVQILGRVRKLACKSLVQYSTPLFSTPKPLFSTPNLTDKSLFSSPKPTSPKPTSPKPIFSLPKPHSMFSTPSPPFSSRNLTLKSLFSSPKPTLLPKPLSSSLSRKSFSTQSDGSKSVLVKVVERFDFENLNDTDFDEKIEVILRLFPQTEGDSSMRRTVSKYLDYKRESHQNFFFVEVCVADCVPIFLLISMENAWCLGVKIGRKLFVFDDEDPFSKLVVPYLGMEPDDINYMKVNFSPDCDLPFTLDMIKYAIWTISAGYTEGSWFMNCLALIYWIIMRSVLSPVMKDFVINILQNRGWDDGGELPSNVQKLFIEWGGLSKWFMNDGSIGEKFLVGEKEYDPVTIRSALSVIHSSKEGREHGPPKVEKVVHNPSKRIANEMRAAEDKKIWEEKKAEKLRRKKEEEAAPAEEVKIT